MRWAQTTFKQSIRKLNLFPTKWDSNLSLSHMLYYATKSVQRKSWNEKNKVFEAHVLFNFFSIFNQMAHIQCSKWAFSFIPPTAVTQTIPHIWLNRWSFLHMNIPKNKKSPLCNFLDVQPKAHYISIVNLTFQLAASHIQRH